jgi:hypothetical protein
MIEWVIVIEVNPMPTRIKLFHMGYLMLSEQNQNVMGLLILRYAPYIHQLTSILRFIAYA